MDWITVAMEEYKTLREESLSSMKMQQSILTFGTATIGIILSAGFNVWDKQFLPEIIFMALLPAVSYLIVLSYIGETGRMFRAGRFIALIENKINSRFLEKEKALSWETWLLTTQNDGKTPHHNLWFHHISIFIFFILVSFISIFIGNIKLYKVANSTLLFFIDMFEAGVLLKIIEIFISLSKLNLQARPNLL
jgi:hypothetical protein